MYNPFVKVKHNDINNKYYIITIHGIVVLQLL